MARKIEILVILILLTGRSASEAITWKVFDPLAIGGRFEHDTSISPDSEVFPWNTTTRSANDRTRLMLDLFAGSRYGDVYLKGSATWSAARPSDIHKQLRFAQGDYLWSQDLSRVDYSLRLFANERRFFTHDMIAPLLDDDLADEDRDNLGVRLDARFGADVDVTALYSSLLDDNADSRRVAYLRSVYSSRLATVHVSYLLDHLGEHVDRNHAVVKLEASTSYKKAYLVLSYQQSGLEDKDIFLPSGRITYSDFANVSSMLPSDAAAFAELRFAGVGLRKVGKLDAVYRYAAIGEHFFNDLGLVQTDEVRRTAALYFRATQVRLNARLLYSSFARSHFEVENMDRWEGSVTGTLRNGLDFWLRGSVSNDIDPLFDEVGNFAHAAVHRQGKKIRSGAYVMWKDVNTVFSNARFAWDGNLALSPNWGLYWRFLLSSQFDLGQALYTRLSFRPNDRIFLTLSYGRSALGDGPYVLEDYDVELSRFDSAVYRVTLRGDF